MAGGTPPP
ncbi:hypothetical protein ECEC4402_5785, partial [Escherichia coli EC4402]